MISHLTSVGKKIFPWLGWGLLCLVSVIQFRTAFESFIPWGGVIAAAIHEEELVTEIDITTEASFEDLATDLVTRLDNIITLAELEKKRMPLKLTIPAIGLELPIVSAPLENNTWPVQDYVANYAQGTSLVNGEEGNVGLFGHDRPQAFAEIKKLVAGDKILVETDEYMAIYEVASSTQITPGEVQVLYPTDEPTLTLLTCDGIFSQHRYMVQAKLVKIEWREHGV